MINSIRTLFNIAILVAVVWFIYGLYMRNTGFDNRQTYERQKKEIQNIDVKKVYESMDTIDNLRGKLKEFMRKMERARFLEKLKNRKRPVLRRR